MIPMFPEVTVSGGSAYERGRTYGSRVPALIANSIATYARLYAFRRGMDWAASQEAALAYQPIIQESASEVLEEIRGIADGSGRKLAEILALNVRTELLAGREGGHVHPAWQEALPMIMEMTQGKMAEKAIITIGVGSGEIIQDTMALIGTNGR